MYDCRSVAGNFVGGGGGAYLKNRDQIINVGMIGHESAEDIKFLGGSGGMLRRKNLRSSNCWKCTETVTTLFCIILNLLRSLQADHFAHPAHIYIYKY